MLDKMLQQLETDFLCFSPKVHYIVFSRKISKCPMQDVDSLRNQHSIKTKIEMQPVNQYIQMKSKFANGKLFPNETLPYIPLLTFSLILTCITKFSKCSISKMVSVDLSISLKNSSSITWKMYNINSVLKS